MTRILHLFDGGADWEQRVAVTQLLERLPDGEHLQWLASISVQVPGPDWFDGRDVVRTPARLGLAFSASPSLRRLMETQRIDLVHAWGTQAAVAASAARPDGCGLVVGRFDPYVSTAEAKMCRTIGGHERFAFSCSCQRACRRLIECGVPADRCVIIRPGVDFGVIRAAKKDKSIRRDLGLTPKHRVLIAAHPVDRRGGHDRILWGGHLCHYVDTSCRLVLYGDSAECRRLERLSRGMIAPHATIWPGIGHRYEDLIAVADALVITANTDVPTTPIAWAMAASVPVLGSAVYCVAELIAHKQNGLLIKPDAGPATSVAIAAMWTRLNGLDREKEVARGQAYEVFSARRFVDQHLTLYDNLARGIRPSENIHDSAVVQ